jgi:hypothetical protein
VNSEPTPDGSRPVETARAKAESAIRQAAALALMAGDDERADELRALLRPRPTTPRLRRIK